MCLWGIIFVEREGLFPRSLTFVLKPVGDRLELPGVGGGSGERGGGMGTHMPISLASAWRCARVGCGVASNNWWRACSWAGELRRLTYGTRLVIVLDKPYGPIPDHSRRGHVTLKLDHVQMLTLD